MWNLQDSLLIIGLAVLILVYYYRRTVWGNLARKLIVMLVNCLVATVLLYGYGLILEFIFAGVGVSETPFWLRLGFVIAITMQIGSFVLAYRTDYRRIAWILFFLSISTMLSLLTYMILKGLAFPVAEREALKPDAVAPATQPGISFSHMAMLVGFFGTLAGQLALELLRYIRTKNDDLTIPADELR